MCNLVHTIAQTKKFSLPDYFSVVWQGKISNLVIFTEPQQELHQISCSRG